MLTLTENAESAVRSIVAEQTENPRGGLRIQGSAQSEAGFALTLAPEPEPEDAVIESGEARVFLESGTALELSDKVLDADVTPEGAVKFALATQAA